MRAFSLPVSLYLVFCCDMSSERTSDSESKLVSFSFNFFLSSYFRSTSSRSQLLGKLSACTVWSSRSKSQSSLGKTPLSLRDDVPQMLSAADNLPLQALPEAFLHSFLVTLSSHTWQGPAPSSRIKVRLDIFPHSFESLFSSLLRLGSQFLQPHNTRTPSPFRSTLLTMWCPPKCVLPHFTSLCWNLLATTLVFQFHVPMFVWCRTPVCRILFWFGLKLFTIFPFFLLTVKANCTLHKNFFAFLLDSARSYLCQKKHLSIIAPSFASSSAFRHETFEERYLLHFLLCGALSMFNLACVPS